MDAMDYVLELILDKIADVANMSCCKPLIQFFEYEINDDIFISNSKDLIPITPQTDIELLKDKVICEYKLLITLLEKGQKPNIEFILEEISAIDIEKEIDNREFIIQYYLNSTDNIN